MTNIPILDAIEDKKDEIENIKVSHKVEIRSLDHKYEMAKKRLQEIYMEKEKNAYSDIDRLSKKIETLSLYNGELLAAALASLLSAYEGVPYYYKKDKDGYIITDPTIQTTQEQQLYEYKLKKDLDKLKAADVPKDEKDLVFLPPREYYTNVLYGYDRQISKVQKTIEDFIDYLFTTRIEKKLKKVTRDDFEIILLNYLTKENVIDEYLARGSERNEELKIFEEIHARKHNKDCIEIPTSYYFKALRELIKRAESDRFSVEHSYTEDGEDIIFEMLVDSLPDIMPIFNSCIQMSIGDKVDGHYPKTLTFSDIELHINQLYKYIPRIKKFMENLYSIAILKKKDGIIVLEESDIKTAFDLTIKQKSYALTKVKKTKKGV